MRPRSSVQSWAATIVTVVFGLLAGGTSGAQACTEWPSAPSSRWATASIGGSMYLKTPCGDRFYSLGVNVLDAEVPSKPLPERVHYDWRNFYPSTDAWLAETRARMGQWGFNTAGAWSMPMARLGLPSTPNLELGRLARFHWFDPFDPATEVAMREQAERLVAPYRGNPLRIGYFSDNEVGWWNGALFVFYSTKPAESFTKQRWIEALRDHYAGDFDRFALDFAPPAGVLGWADLAATQRPTRMRPGGQGIEAVRRWTGIVSEHYYAMIARVLHEADPDALLLGDRLPIYYDPVAVRAMARHLDVIAVNYNVDSHDGWIARYFFDGLRQLSGGKPVLISEWFFAANQNRTGNRNNGHLMTVETQAERAQGAAVATSGFAAVPEIVGAHWFQFPDHPRGGRGDGEDYNFGLVDIDNRPYEELIAALGPANRGAARQHGHAAAEVAARPARPIAIPRATISTTDQSLRDWPKPASLLPPLVPSAGEVAFGESYLAWSEAGLAFATIGQDYYDLDLLAYEGDFPLGEAYRLEIGVDAGAGPRRFTLFFIPPRTKTKDHPPMAALLCVNQPATIAACERVPGSEAVYFGADQPRITAEGLLPWGALGLAGPPSADRLPAERLKIEIAAVAWHRSRWMSLSGLPPDEGMAQPERWASVRLSTGKVAY